MTAKTAAAASVPKRKSAGIENEAVRAKAITQRVNKPVLLKGVSLGALITVKPSAYKLLDIDPEYQRGEVKAEVNSLVAAIEAGGFIPDPVTLVKRTWVNGTDASKLWIIDGQQRVAAFQLMDREFQAMVYTADSYEAEKNFFLVMNTRQAVNASTFVHSWPGLGAELIRRANDQEGHPLHGRVLWGPGSGARIAGAILVKGLLGAASGSAAGGSIQNTLSRLDHALKDHDARERARLFLELVAHVFPTSYAPTLAMQALGQVAYRRWLKGALNLPAARRMSNIAVLKWDKLVPSYAARYRGVLELEIDKRWSGAVEVFSGNARE